MMRELIYMYRFRLRSFVSYIFYNMNIAKCFPAGKESVKNR